MNYSVKLNEQSQACLSYAIAKNSLILMNIFVKQWTEDKLVWIMSLRENV